MNISNNYKDYDEHEEKQETAVTRQMLMTLVDGKDFAIPFEEIVEISRIKVLTPVPEFPKYAPGVVQVGEYAVPAIDARARFGYAPTTDYERSCLVVTYDGEKRIGIIVDAVKRFRDTLVSDIQEAPQLNDEAYSRYITGMFQRKTENKICYIISPKLMYSLTEREALLGKDEPEEVPVPQNIEL